MASTTEASELTFRLTDGSSVFGVLWRLAIPALAEQVLHLMVGISDTVLTGRVLPESTPAHLAAVNSTGYLMWLLTELFVFVAVGASALIARFVGAGDAASAGRTANQAFLLGLVGAAAATLALYPMAGPLAGLLRLEGESERLAVVYLKYVLPTLPFIMLEALTVACLRGAGDAKAGLFVLGLVNVLNVTISWAAVVGFGPVPACGWDGIAIGTACGHVGGGLLGLAFLVFGRAGLKLNLSALRPDWPLQLRILRIGVPGGLDILCVILCQIWFLGIVNTLGDVSSAAHGLAIRIESLAFTPATAFQLAAATMVGQFLGAGDLRRATQSVWMACGLCMAVVLVAGAVFFCFGADIAVLGIGRDKPEVVALTAALLKIVAFGMPSLAIMMIFNAALRGAGDTRFPLVSNLLGFAGVRIPLAYLFTSATCGWGVVGAWYAMLIDILFRSCLSFYRFREGTWMRLKI